MCGDSGLVASLAELLALDCVLIPIMFLMTVLGVQVVNRFRVDVPKYNPAKLVRPKDKLETKA